jgi:hypothetical protein
LLQYDSLKRLDVAEISKEVREACVFFKDYNHAFYEDPRTHIYIDDAKTFLQLTRLQYDIVVSEPSNPWITGVASLYTTDFFEQVRNHLAPKGIFAQWFHAYQMSEESSKVVIRTMAEVFPYVSLWGIVGSNDFVFIGTEEPIEIHYDAMGALIQDPKIAKDLARAKVYDIPSFLLHQLVPAPSIPGLVGEGPINTDHNPYLEYEAPKDFFLKSSSREFYQRIDEKQTALAHNQLYIHDYLKRYPLSDQNFSNLYATLEEEKSGNEKLVRSITQAWRQSFPKSKALAASGLLKDYGIQDQWDRLKAQEDYVKKNPDFEEYFLEYLVDYFKFYTETRTIFYSVPMEQWVEQCDWALKNLGKDRYQAVKLRELYRRIEGL